MWYFLWGTETVICITGLWHRLHSWITSIWRHQSHLASFDLALAISLGSVSSLPRSTYKAQHCVPWARFLSLVRSKLRLCSANHRAGYFSNLACDWLSIVWAYSEQETENGPWSRTGIHTQQQLILTLPQQQFLPCGSHDLSAASYNGMFQGCSIGSIQAVNNNYSQALTNQVPVSDSLCKVKWSGWLVIDSSEE